MTRSPTAAPARPLIHQCPCGNRPGSTLVRVQHGADRVDGQIEPARDFAIGGFETVAARGLRVEVGGKLRAIRAERLDLCGELVLAMIGLAPALGRSLERIERRRQAAAGCLDCARIAHDCLPAPRGRRTSIGKYLPQQGVAEETYGV